MRSSWVGVCWESPRAHDVTWGPCAAMAGMGLESSRGAEGSSALPTKEAEGNGWSRKWNWGSAGGNASQERSSHR